MNELLRDFVFFFAVIDPVGTVPVFIAVTARHPERERPRIALRATWISALILLFFVVAGEPLLDAVDIPLSAFQIAGGIVLFLFALTMIFGDSKPEAELELVRSSEETAVFPLAVPSIAGPGSMLGAVLMTENARYGLGEQVRTSLAMLAVLFVALLLMLAAGRIQRLIGDSGASIVSRVMGLILAALAVSNVLGGVKEYFAL